MGTIEEPGFPHVERAGDTALKVTWSRVAGADGYEVFRYNSAQGRYTKVATVRSGTVLRWTNKRLKTGKKYVYKARAYKNVGLAKEYSDFTYPVSAVPYKRDAKVVNAGATLKGAASMEIGLMQKQKVEVSAVPSAYGTAKERRVVDPSIRLLATNPVVSIESGNVVGKSVGTTHVYALAHNGNVKRIHVEVVDYARPTTWENLD
ncbi:MAG: fibronectin type III domain-containing protein, partial [Clostridiales Family XIII bacterium]|nr:fibronectin type III domain-containing protein [Clostridiales Family XIII bacterium]